MARKKKSAALAGAAASAQGSQSAPLLGENWTLLSPDPQLATDCDAALTEFCKRSRPKAKKALQKLAKEHPFSPLPNRYLARMLYHEAANLDGTDVGTPGSSARLDLLTAGLAAVTQACTVCKDSLSCAALRAVLVINVLVEHSMCLAGLAGGTARSHMPTGQQCEAMREQFRFALEDCRRVLLLQSPIANEPVIRIVAGNQKSYDPCCMRVQEKALEWLHAERWGDIVAEKRHILRSMQDVLQSCYTLLSHTQIPINGVVSLLQHILYPHKEELQVWANQLLCKGFGLDGLQSQADNRSTMVELMKLMRQPGAGALAPALPHLSAAPEASQACLSVERVWDYGKDAAAVARRKTRGKDRRAEMTLEERYNDVRDFWARLPLQERKKLLRVPLRSLLEGLKREHGAAAAREMHQGLLLLQSQGSRRACYWSCPFCPSCRVGSMKEYLDHIEASHGEVQVDRDGAPTMCMICNLEVVGTHYRSVPEPGLFMCLRCHWNETSTGRHTPGVHPFRQVESQSSSALVHWEDQSEGLSTKDSFGSLDEEYLAALQELPSSLIQFGRMPTLELGDAPATTAPQLASAASQTLSGGGQSRSLHDSATTTERAKIGAPPGEGSGEASSSQGAGLTSADNHPSSQASSSQGSWLPKQLQQWQLAAASKLSSLVSSQATRQQKGISANADCVSDAGPSLQSQAGTSNAAQASGDSRQSQETTEQLQGIAQAAPNHRQGLIGEVPLGDLERNAASSSDTGLQVSQPPLLASERPQRDGSAYAHWSVYNSLSLLGRRSVQDTQLVNSIMRHINALWSLDRDNFGSVLNAIIQRAAQLLQHMAEQHAAALAMQNPGSTPAVFPGFSGDFTKSLQHPDNLEAALSQLPGSDLQSLLNFILMKAPAGLAAHADRRASDIASTCDGLGEPEEEPGCPPLFQLAELSEPAEFESLVESVVASSEGSANGTELALCTAGPALELQPWWLEHLLEKGREEGGQSASGELRLLRWVYGNVVNAAAQKFLERRRELLGERSPDAVMLDLLEDIAYSWRHLHELTEKKRVLLALREAAKRYLREVKELEERGLGATRTAATEYADAVMPIYSSTAADAPQQFCDCATQQMHNNEVLSSLDTIQYAQLLVERERAVLELEQAMFDQEVREAQLDATAAQERYDKACAETAEAEAELARVQAEGPANHRKKDLIDKATKEAEHREKLSDLRTRIDAGKDRSAQEESACHTAKAQEETARRELLNVQQQMNNAMQHHMQLSSVCGAHLAEDVEGDEAAAWQHHIQAAWYRLLYVAQAIAAYSRRNYQRPGSREADLFLHTSRTAKQLMDTLEADIRKFWEDLERTRHKLQELSCVDLSLDVSERALEVVRAQIEDAARRAKEEASSSLLRELEEEEAAKKMQEEKKGKKGKAKQKEKLRISKVTKGESSAEEVGPEEAATEGHTQTDADTARLLELADYEAALERRRKEVEAERQRSEMEQIRLLEAFTRSATPAAKPTLLPVANGQGPEEVDSSSDDEDLDERSQSSEHADTVSLARSSAANGETAGHATAQTSAGRANGGEAGTRTDGQAASKDGLLVETKKKKSRKQRYKENKEKEKEAETPKQTLRIVSFFGDWACECGQQNRLWDTCECGQSGPCRDWVRGRCKYKANCRFAHPPFQLPDGPAPPSPIARPSADAPLLDAQGVLLPPSAQPPAPAPTRAVPVGKAAATASASASVPNGASPPGTAAANGSAGRELLSGPTSSAESSATMEAAWNSHAKLHDDGKEESSRRSSAIAHGGPSQPPANRTPKKPAKPVRSQPETPAAEKGGSGHLRTRSLSRLSDLEEPQPKRGSSPVAVTRDDVDLQLHSQPTADEPKAQDVVVPAPRRATSAKQLLAPQTPLVEPPPGWPQMGSWGGLSSLGSLSASDEASASFNPFAENPLQRALAADYKRDAGAAGQVVRPPSRAHSFSQAGSRGPIETPRRASCDGVNNAVTALMAPQQQPHATPMAPSVPTGSASAAMDRTLGSTLLQSLGLSRPPSRLTASPLPPVASPQHSLASQAFAFSGAQRAFTPPVGSFGLLSGLQASPAASLQAFPGINGSVTAQRLPELSAMFRPGQPLQPSLAAASAALSNFHGPARPFAGQSPYATNGALGSRPFGSMANSTPAFRGQPIGGSALGLANGNMSGAFEADMETALQAGLRDQGAYANGVAGISLHSLAGRDKQDLEGCPLLNALVQALSSLPRVRQALLSVQAAQLMETPWKGVLLALQGLFADLSKQAGGRAPGPTPSKLWDMLTQRLDAAGGRAVPSAQVLTWMLECLDRALLPGNLQAQRAHTPTLIKHLFGLQSEEAALCSRCGRQDRQVGGFQLVREVPAAALRSAGALPRAQRPSFERLLQSLTAAEPRTCRSDLGGCGASNNAVLSLRSLPAVLALCLTWDSVSAGMVDTAAVCAMLPTSLNLGQIYGGGRQAGYRLQSLVCRGREGHWLMVADGNRWRIQADTPKQIVGSWMDVLVQCRNARLQPLYLLLEAEY